MIAAAARAVIALGAKILTGAQGRWIGCAPTEALRIYCANHTSHIDFLLLWSALPGPLRSSVRPVAASDYWLSGPVRRYLIQEVFQGVLVDRGGPPAGNPLQAAMDALSRGESLIFFPEGTRGTGDALLPFKSGIHHLVRCVPRAEVVPVWIDNAYRVMPKGFIFPVPLLCSMSFGTPLRYTEGEPKEDFLFRLRSAMLELRPQ
ncbi:MAG: 1-acyl-sn-glycerol-3-phosphate acyltransferase [Acidobacteria bacterium]|nr:1-acyl-sn-glycerol-3-phosphate acyltransferase [Acidobacteriota bacterium]